MSSTWHVALVLIAFSLAACSDEPDPVYRSGPRRFIASAPPPPGYYRQRDENDWDEDGGRNPDRPPRDEPEPTPPPDDYAGSQNIPENSDIQPDSNAPAPTPSSLPTARSLGNGRVESPYAPGKQVDVQGYPPGSTVRDPYTGQLFLVPIPQSGGQ